jgi:O-antigen biosynthesis protein
MTEFDTIARPIAGTGGQPTTADRESEAYAAISGAEGRPLLWCDTPAWETEPRVAAALILNGWALADPGPAKVTIELEHGPAWTVLPWGTRMDVVSLYGRQYGEDQAIAAGWSLGLDVSAWEEGPHKLAITAHDGQGLTTSIRRTIVVDPCGLHAEWLAARQPCRPRRWPHRKGQMAQLAVWAAPPVEGSGSQAIHESLAEQTLGGWRNIAAADFPDALEAFRAGDEELLAVITGDCVLEPHALQALAETYAAVAGPPDLIYGDDDTLLPDGRRTEPRLKPHWSPELLLASDYIGPFLALSRRAVEQTLTDPAGPPSSIYELAVRLIDRDPWVERVPDILASWAGGPPLVSGPAASEPIEALGRDRGTQVEVRTVDAGIREIRFAKRGKPLVSVVIPTAGTGGHLDCCLEAIATRSTYEDLEVVIANTSGGDLRAVAPSLELLRHRIVDVPGPFNYSRVNNTAANAASGKYLIFLNDDCEIVTPDWVELLLGAAQQPGIGLVGADLHYPSGLVQCAGVRITRDHATQVYLRFPPAAEGGPARLRSARNCSAVGTACALMPSDLFASLGGFDEHYAVELGDVDLGLRVLSTGRRVLWTPIVRAIHHERGSRGHSEPHLDDHARFRQRWSGLRTAGDPFYHPGLDPEADFEPLATPPPIFELVGQLARTPDEDPPTRPTPQEVVGSDAHDWVERFSPWEHAGALIDAEHTARYRWLAPAVSGCDVLDAACGTAYGTDTFKRAGARRAVGVDISHKTIAEASLLLGDAQIELFQADIQSLPFDDASFDVISSFETIEHIEDPGRTLDELRRVLRPDGLLAVSSPNRGIYNAGNPFHVAELTPKELREALESRFRHVAMFSQQAWLTSALVSSENMHESPDEPLDAQLGRVAALEPGREYYTVGLASDAPLPELDGVALLADPGGPYALGERIMADEATHARIKNDRNTLRIQLATASRELEAANTALAACEDGRRRAEHWLGVVQQSLSWRITSPLRAASRRAAKLRRG